MATTGLQIDPEELKRNLAITLGTQPQQLPKPEMAAPGPIDMPGSKSPDLSIQTAKPQVQAPRGTIQGEQAKRSQILSSGSGISQIPSKIENSQFGQNHPTLGKIAGEGLGGLAKLGDIGLSAVAPSLAINLPGTEYHHQALLNRENKQITGLESEQKEQAQSANLGATTAETQARVPLTEAQTRKTQAETAALPQQEADKHDLAQSEVAGSNPDIATYRSLVKIGMSPSEALKEVEKDKAMALKPPGGEHVAFQNSKGQQFEGTYDPQTRQFSTPDGQVVTDAKPIPPPTAGGPIFVTPEGKIVKPGVGGTVAPGSMSPTQVGQGAAADVKEKKTEEKAAANLDSELILMKQFAASPSPTNDAAMLMHYIGATKPESMGKIRLNQNELDFFGKTRSSLGDAEALLSKIGNGQSLTPQQRSDMVNTMTMIDQASKRSGGGQGSGITVTAPNGKVYPFKDQASADAFKKEAGIK